MWMVLAYFVLFDLGVGRAVTKFVAELLAQNKFDELPTLIWTAWLVLALMGFVAGILLFALAPMLIASMRDLAPALQQEALHSFSIISISVPLLMLVPGLRGVLEAQGRFGLTNLVAVPGRIANYLVPLLSASLSPRLEFMVGSLVLCQLLTAVAYFLLAMRSIPRLWELRRVELGQAKRLIGFGAWLTVSAVLSPLMQYCDRFFIAAFISVSAVAYYTIPYDAISRLVILPEALSLAVFPVFSQLSSVGSQTESLRLLRTSATFILFTTTPLVLLMVALAREILQMWMGATFVSESATIFQIITVGVLLINSLGRIYTGWIHGDGNSKITATFHMIEAPLYLIGLLLLLTYFGLTGVALAGLLRVGLDTLLLGTYIQLRTREQSSGLIPLIRPALLGAVAVVAAAAISSITVLVLKLAAVALLLLLYIITSWHFALTATDKELLAQKCMSAFHRVIGARQSHTASSERRL
jgi:O-antigen/teichoic acid export membrane protein